MKIAIQGEPGSFSHEAALKFVPDAAIVPCALSADVFAALNSGNADAAAIPIENSLAGSVIEHFDLLLTQDVRVERETLLRIRHNLIAISGAQIGEIDRVFSHPVALAQCRQIFRDHPRMSAQPFYDTAGSVKNLVALGDSHAAAIASEAAARYYGAQILQSGIEDTIDPLSNKISLAFSSENRPGKLVAALSGFADLGANMTKIESRPVHGKPWEYIFFIDCQIPTPEVADQLLAALKPHCAMLQELGRYQEAPAVRQMPSAGPRQ